MAKDFFGNEEVKTKKRGKVKNGPIGRIFRTLGFLLVLVASLFLVVINVRRMDVSFINGFMSGVYSFFDTTFVNTGDYIYSALAVGLLLLVWTQSNSIFMRVITTVLGAFALIGLSYASPDANNKILFFSLGNKIGDFYNNLFGKFTWLEMVLSLVPLLFAYLILAFKRPERISSRLVSSGLLILLIGVVGVYLPVITTATWASNSTVLVIVYGVLSISYLLTALGSVFGVLGLLRK
ncbi:MAG: hypothetical protein RBQ97_08745 [Acholeplasma sp.]|nr:hypothetical protein [Acholeplasma sp.]